jgi:hypothetical protein
MEYHDWTINGIKPFNIESMDDTAFPKITLHCAAHYTDDRYDTPMDEINAFKAMACNKITNEPTQSGGTDVQTSMDNTIIPISNGTDNWLGALCYPQYTPDNMAETLIEFDLILELALVNTSIIPDTPNPPDITKPYNLITNGYSYNIGNSGVASQLLGSFSFNWDGTGHIYVASDWQADPETDVINIDDKIIITNEEGTTIEATYGRETPTPGTDGPDLNITSLLVEGENQITVTIVDVYGTHMGCGPLFMIQTA